jgi:acetyl-CoA carboxylase carboxyltransferase component
MDKERRAPDPEELANAQGGESWQREVDEIRRRTELAGLMGGRANIERQHQAGRLTVRERIDALLDPGSFHETGALAGKAEYDDAGHLTSFTPSNFVAGTGRIDGRRVVVGGDDFTVRGGAADGVVGNKAGYAEKLALGIAPAHDTAGRRNGRRRKRQDA